MKKIKTYLRMSRMYLESLSDDADSHKVIEWREGDSHRFRPQSLNMGKDGSFLAAVSLSTSVS